MASSAFQKLELETSVEMAGWRVCVAVVAVVAVVAALPCCDAVFTKVKQGQQKCFIELLHANEPMVVKYESPDQASLPQEPDYKGHIGIYFQVVNHKGKVYDHRLDRKGRLSFVSRMRLVQCLGVVLYRRPAV
jgi:hypothetical protein